MSAERKLWLGLLTLLTVSFSVLLWVGTEIHRQMPPIPARIVSSTGETVFIGHRLVRRQPVVATKGPFRRQRTSAQNR